MRRAADLAKLAFREHATAAATTHGIKRRAQRIRESTRSSPAFLQKMERHALRGLGTHSRQGPKRIDETSELW
jgi:hypothetical protein